MKRKRGSSRLKKPLSKRGDTRGWNTGTTVLVKKVSEGKKLLALFLPPKTLTVATVQEELSQEQTQKVMHRMGNRLRIYLP